MARRSRRRRLAAAGLKLVLGTPTASPPKWLIDAYPEVLPVRADGTRWNFGSRRHYDISSETYRRECVRIVTAMAERYGRNPSIVAWQTDNELGCHDTVPSYSPAALKRFQAGCAVATKASMRSTKHGAMCSGAWSIRRSTQSACRT